MLPQDLDHQAKFLSYKLIIGRCAYHAKKMDRFNRHSENLCAILKENVIDVDTQAAFGCRSKNAQYQRQLFTLIDGIIEKEIDKTNPENARLLKPKMISDKLVLQDHKCALCGKSIKSDDEYHGDHIVPWTAGGKTTMENLQVVHKRCHHKKN